MCVNANVNWLEVSSFLSSFMSRFSIVSLSEMQILTVVELFYAKNVNRGVFMNLH